VPAEGVLYSRLSRV